MKKWNAFHLKMIAIVAMFINHLGHAFKFYYNPTWWENSYLTIGMLTFPIMAYLLVEGFFYTRNRLAYAVRLGIFSVISFLPYHYLFFPALPLWFGNNIMFSLMLGVLLMILCEKVSSSILQAIFLIISIMITSISDWGLFGVAIIFFLYKARGRSDAVKWVIIANSSIMFYIFYAIIGWERAIVNLGMLGVIPLLSAYNGQRGYSTFFTLSTCYCFGEFVF